MGFDVVIFFFLSVSERVGNKEASLVGFVFADPRPELFSNVLQGSRKR